MKVIVTGGFDPIHSGHLAYFKAARMLGDSLIVGVNSDKWLLRKKGYCFLPFSERKNIVENIKAVDFAIVFDDTDNTAMDAIRVVRDLYPNDTIIFANGGDRTADNIPEMSLRDNNLKFVFGVGGSNKLNSSSQIIKDFTRNES